MVKTTPEEKIEVRCSNCGKLLKPNEDEVIQIRTGYVDDDGEFHPNNDVGLYCNECE